MASMINTKHTRSPLMGVMCFVDQVVRIFSHPLMKSGRNCGGVFIQGDVKFLDQLRILTLDEIEHVLSLVLMDSVTHSTRNVA